MGDTPAGLVEHSSFMLFTRWSLLSVAATALLGVD